MSRFFRRPAVTAAVALVLLLAAYLFSSRISPMGDTSVTAPEAEPIESRPVDRETERNETRKRLPVLPLSDLPKESESVKHRAAVAVAPSPAPELSLAESIPDLQTIREQVAKDPHTTSSAILAFSVELTQRMLELATDEVGAERAFGELEDCVLNDRQKDSNTVQALCLLHAHKLALKYPALNARFEQLATRADAESVRRAKALF